MKKTEIHKINKRFSVVIGETIFQYHVLTRNYRARATLFSSVYDKPSNLLLKRSNFSQFKGTKKTFAICWCCIAFCNLEAPGISYHNNVFKQNILCLTNEMLVAWNLKFIAQQTYAQSSVTRYVIPRFRKSLRFQLKSAYSLYAVKIHVRLHTPVHSVTLHTTSPLR